MEARQGSSRIVGNWGAQQVGNRSDRESTMSNRNANGSATSALGRAMVVVFLLPLGAGCDSTNVVQTTNVARGGSRSAGGASTDEGGQAPVGGSATAGGASGTECPAGSELCACYGNNTCNEGLVCASHICVNIAAGGAGGAGGEPAQGGSVAGGSPATGGLSSAGGSPGNGGTNATGGVAPKGGSTGLGGAPTGGTASGVGGTTAKGGTSSGLGGAATGGGTSTSAAGTTSKLPATCQTVDAGLTLYDGTPEDGACTSSLNLPRIGYWYSFNDGTGTQTPANGAAHNGVLGGRGGSADCAMHNTGSGFTDWGGSFGFDFNPAQTGKCIYDASGYAGIRLYLKGATTGTVGSGSKAKDNSVRVNIGTPATVATTEGGSCTGTKCNDHFGEWCTVTSSYAVCNLDFATISQAGWGTAATFDRSKLLQFFVQAVKDKNATSDNWDIWLDDVQFYQ
jgi:hypothetical protein